MLFITASIHHLLSPITESVKGNIYYFLTKFSNLEEGSQILLLDIDIKAGLAHLLNK